MLHTHWELVVDLNLGLKQKVFFLMRALMTERKKKHDQPHTGSWSFCLDLRDPIVAHISLARANLASAVWMVLNDSRVCYNHHLLLDPFLLLDHHLLYKIWSGSLWPRKMTVNIPGRLSQVSLELLLGIPCLPLLSQLCVPVALREFSFEPLVYFSFIY